MYIHMGMSSLFGVPAAGMCVTAACGHPDQAFFDFCILINIPIQFLLVPLIV